MSDRDAFLRAIIDRPDDDLPRLAFADWLEERGECERSEFIRVQVELATWELKRGCQKHCTGCEPRPVPRFGSRVRTKPVKVCARGRAMTALRRRERELMTSAHALQWGPHRALWADGLERPFCIMPGNDDLCRQGYIGVQFARGFVSAVTLSWADWLAHHAALLDATPLRGVRRERACGDCKGDGISGPVRHDGIRPRSCPACRGTGRVAAWAGGGRVVLTTWPEVERWPITHGPPLVRLRKPTDHGIGGNAWVSECPVTELLAAEWPGVEFRLPAAYEPAQLTIPPGGVRIGGVTIDWSQISAATADTDYDRPTHALPPGTIIRIGGRP